MALTDVIDRLTEVNEEQLVETQDIKIEIETLSDRMGSLLELNKQDRLDRLEAMREGAGFAPPSMTAGDAGVAVNDKTGGLFNLGDFGILDLLGLSALFARVKQIFGVIGSIVATLGKVFAVGALVSLEKTLKILQGSFQLIENLAFKLKNLPGFGKLADFLARITLAFEDMATKVDDLRKALSGPLKFLGNIGKVFGKLFWPLTAFMAAWSGVKGFIEGYQEDGIIGGIQGAVTGFFNSLIFAPLDLLKNATQWIFNKIGLTKVSDALSKFSFQEIFEQIVGKIFDGVKGAVNFVKGLFGFGDPEIPFKMSEFLGMMVKNVFGKIGDAFSEFALKLELGAKVAGKVLITDIMNIPDRILKFLSENLRIDIPRISIPIPKGARFIFGGAEEIVLFEGANLGVPGGEGAAIRIASRNESRDAEIAEFGRQYVEKQNNMTGMAVQQLNTMAGASGGGTTVIYQTTNNVSGGGGGGSTGTPNASSSTAAASNDHQGTLDATQYISGAPAR